jgi:secreted PhoX family phosphatase
MKRLITFAILAALTAPSFAGTDRLGEDAKQRVRDVCSGEILHPERAVYRFARFGVGTNGVSLCGSVTVGTWRRTFVWVRSPTMEKCVINDVTDPVLAIVCPSIVPNP